MLSTQEFATLTESHPAIKKMNAKVTEIIRDELEPGVTISYSQSVQVGGKDGVVFLTETDLFAFWMMKILIFIKLPTQQQFHLSQIRKIEPNGNNVYVRSEVDPAQPDDDYEESNFTFDSSTAAQAFCEALNSAVPK